MLILDCTMEEMSLTYKVKRRGPKMDPYGTPEEMSDHAGRIMPIHNYSLSTSGEKGSKPP